jgi:type IV pilus assembly protein PilM
MFIPQPPFGLDVSDLSLKLIALRKKGNQFYLTSYNQIKVPEGYFIDGEIKEKKKIANLIRKLIKEVKGEKIRTPYFISILPERKTFIKLIEVPRSQDDKVNPEDVEKEIQRHIPLPLEEIYFDWQKIAPRADKMKILVSTAPKKIVEDYLSLFEEAEIKLVALEPEGASLTRALIKENYLEEGVIIFDIGAKRSSLVVFDRGTIQFTISAPISGEEITKTISQKLKISLDEAEKAKIVCGFSEKKCQGILEKILSGVVNNLVQKIEETQTFYKEDHLPPNHRKITKVLLCGGGANFKGIEKILSKRLNLEVKKGNPLQQITLSKGLSFTQSEALIYTTAIGLALRGVVEG